MSDEPFYHVYELPERNALANGFAFGGGKSIQFLNVDWFGGRNPMDGTDVTEADLRTFLSRKRYIKPGKRYLVLGSPGHTFVIEPLAVELVP